jgi:hypothetical protein
MAALLALSARLTRRKKTNSWRATTRPARIASVKDAALIWNLSNIDHCHGTSLAQTGDITAAPIRCHR